MDYKFSEGSSIVFNKQVKKQIFSFESFVGRHSFSHILSQWEYTYIRKCFFTAQTRLDVKLEF